MFSIITTLILIIRFNIFVGLFFLLWILTGLLISSKLAQASSKISKIYYNFYSKLNGSIIDSILNNLNVKISGSKSLEKKYLERINKEEVESKRESLYKIFEIRTNLRF